MDGDGRDGGGGCKDAGSEDYENLPTSASLSTHMTAGAMAGILEHSVMYPVDSVKVRREETSGSGRAGRRARVHAFASRARAVRGSAPKARSPRAAAPRGSPRAGARSRGAAARAARLLPPPGPPLPSPRGCPAGARGAPPAPRTAARAALPAAAAGAAGLGGGGGVPKGGERTARRCTLTTPGHASRAIGGPGWLGAARAGAPAARGAARGARARGPGGAGCHTCAVPSSL